MLFNIYFFDSIISNRSLKIKHIEDDVMIKISICKKQRGWFFQGLRILENIDSDWLLRRNAYVYRFCRCNWNMDGMQQQIFQIHVLMYTGMFNQAERFYMENARVWFMATIAYFCFIAEHKSTYNPRWPLLWNTSNAFTSHILLESYFSG